MNLSPLALSLRQAYPNPHDLALEQACQLYVEKPYPERRFWHRELNQLYLALCALLPIQARIHLSRDFRLSFILRLMGILHLINQKDPVSLAIVRLIGPHTFTVIHRNGEYLQESPLGLHLFSRLESPFHRKGLLDRQTILAIRPHLSLYQNRQLVL